MKCQGGRRAVTFGLGRLFGGRAETSIASAHRGHSPLQNNPGVLLSFCASSLGSPGTVASATGDRWGMVERSPGHVRHV